jgi:hypothetical protein
MITGQRKEHVSRLMAAHCIAITEKGVCLVRTEGSCTCSGSRACSNMGSYVTCYCHMTRLKMMYSLGAKRRNNLLNNSTVP